jgi:hypothetical protein
VAQLIVRRRLRVGNRDRRFSAPPHRSRRYSGSPPETALRGVAPADMATWLLIRFGPVRDAQSQPQSMDVCQL